MQKLFEFDEHIGDWRVLVQSRDIKNGAIQSRHIADNSVTTEKIGDNEVKSRNIDTGAVTTEKIGDREVKSRNIAPGAITNEKLQDECITGDEFEGDTVKNGKLANNAVATRNIKDRNVTSSKIALKNILLEHLSPEIITKLTEDLQNQIDAYNEHGVMVSNQFGTDPHISVSQKTLTDAINRIWQKFEDMTGEILQGINMVVTPDFFISEDGATVHASANTVEANGIFEKLSFYVNGALVASTEQTDQFETDIELTETSLIKCVAKIMGVEHKREKIVTHYNSFWLGAGTAYTDIMDASHTIPITNGMRGAYNVTCAEGDHIFVIVGDKLAAGFIRADLNSIEIPFTESTVTLDGKTYKVFTSDNTYIAGTYNIDING